MVRQARDALLLDKKCSVKISHFSPLTAFPDPLPPTALRHAWGFAIWVARLFFHCVGFAHMRQAWGFAIPAATLCFQVGGLAHVVSLLCRNLGRQILFPSWVFVPHTASLGFGNLGRQPLESK